MSTLKGLWIRLRALIFRERVEEELDDEIRFHLDMATEQLMRRRLSPDEARRKALLEFGGVERFKEKTRDARSLPLMEDLTRNLRVGLRRIASHPVHTFAIVGTLALGIGANTAIFSVVDAVLLRPSPFPEPDRLVMVWETDRASGTMHEPASWPDVVDFRERSRALSAIGSMQGMAAMVTEGDAPERVTGLGVTPELLGVFGVEPLVGRLFAPDEGSAEAPFTTVLLGEAYWRARFEADPDIAGRTLALSDGPATIVGVLPAEADLGVHQVHAQADYAADFQGGAVAVWFPLRPTAEATPRYTHPFLTLGRLAPGTDLETAQAEPNVGVINQSAAERFFGAASALGQEIRFWGQSWRVVGVMGDERFRGPDQANEPAIYVPMAQVPWNRVTLLLRSDRESSALTGEARRVLRELDPELILFGAEPLTAIAEESVSRPRFTATLLGVFAGVAILLAMIGVYGVLNYAVAQRGPEVGIRLALGASRRDVFRDVVGEGLLVTGIGVALGTATALATSRLLQGLVFGVSATDATTYVVVIGLVLSTAVLASLLPALRASRTDPVALFRAE